MSAQPPFDTVGPLRDPRSRKSLRAATRDMARICKTLVAERGEVLDEDLIRAGFSVGELDHCRAGALHLVAGRHQTSRADTVLDMAAFMALRSVEAADGCVTRDDLHQAGFTSSEIDDCHADAVAETRRRLAPREIGRAA